MSTASGGVLDDRIFDFLLRHRIVTTDALDELFFDGRSDARKNWIRRQASHLERFEFVGHRAYYRLSPAGAKQLGHSPRSCCGALGPQALVQAYALLDFAAADPERRLLLLSKEVETHFRDRLVPGTKPTLYLDVDRKGIRRLGHAFVDAGGSPATQFQKLNRWRKKAAAAPQPEVQAMLADQGAVLAYITSSPEKVAALKAAGERARGRTAGPPLPSVLVRFHVAPLLGDLLLTT